MYVYVEIVYRKHRFPAFKHRYSGVSGILIKSIQYLVHSELCLHTSQIFNQYFLNVSNICIGNCIEWLKLLLSKYIRFAFCSEFEVNFLYIHTTKSICSLLRTYKFNTNYNITSQPLQINKRK